MPKQPYLVLAEPVSYQQEIKKSRFITQLAFTQGREQAMAFIYSVKKQHRDARHNCWAFVSGAPDDSVSLGFSDDGEPSGTAGKPMLACLQGSGLGEITVVVTRYSGGIKLGTGGLVRAYGGGVQQALKLASTKQRIFYVRLNIGCDYAQLAIVELLLNEMDGVIAQAYYGEAIQLLVELDGRHCEQFKAQLFDKTHGRVIAKRETD